MVWFAYGPLHSGVEKWVSAIKRCACATGSADGDSSVVSDAGRRAQRGPLSWRQDGEEMSGVVAEVCDMTPASQCGSGAGASIHDVDRAQRGSAVVSYSSRARQRP